MNRPLPRAPAPRVNVPRPVPRSTAAPAPPSTARTALERGRFFLESGALDAAAASLTQAARASTGPEGEEAEHLLGVLEQRRYHQEKEKTGRRDWQRLNLAEAAYGRSQARARAGAGGTWLADSAFFVAIIQIERGVLARARAATQALAAAAATDDRVHVYQVVWSSLPSTVIDGSFSTATLAALLADLIRREKQLSDASIRPIVNALEDRKARRAPEVAPPLVAVAVPHAAAKEKSRQGDMQLYDFSLTLRIPPARRNEVAKVLYRLDHPTFRNKDLIGTDPAHDFAVAYTGWGALSRVDITIHRRDGQSESMAFNMLAILGWD